MSGAADVMVIVMSAFFLVGVTVGIAVVYALSARKTDRARRRNRRGTNTDPRFEPASCEIQAPGGRPMRPERTNQ
jgi:hypothetical protein